MTAPESDQTPDPITESKYATMLPAEILRDYAFVRGDIAEDYALDQLARIWAHQLEQARVEGRAEGRAEVTAAIWPLIKPQWRNVEYDRNALLDDLRAILDDPETVAAARDARTEQAVRDRIARDIHVERFHDDAQGHPDSWYAGMLHAKHLAQGDVTSTHPLPGDDA